MKRQSSQRLMVAVVVMACLATTPAWAYFLQFQNFSMQLPGVHSDGTLSPAHLAVSSTLYILLNTKSHNFVGLASGTVTNAADQYETYVDNPILTGATVVSGLTINHDAYFVDPSGNALYVAVGTEP